MAYACLVDFLIMETVLVPDTLLNWTKLEFMQIVASLGVIRTSTNKFANYVSVLFRFSFARSCSNDTQKVTTFLIQMSIKKFKFDDLWTASSRRYQWKTARNATAQHISKRLLHSFSTRYLLCVWLVFPKTTSYDSAILFGQCHIIQHLV